MPNYLRLVTISLLAASLPISTATPQTLTGDVADMTQAPCPPRTIESFDEASVGRTNCTEVTVKMTGTPNPAGQDDPPCYLQSRRESDATTVAENLDLKLQGASGLIVWSLGGPETPQGLIASLALGVAVGMVVDHNRRFNYSHCATACAKLPVGATKVYSVGWSGPFPSDPAHSNHTALCNFEDPWKGGGRCDHAHNANWARMMPPTSADLGDGQGKLVCSLAKHWTAGIERELGLRVYYDLPPAAQSTPDSGERG